MLLLKVRPISVLQYYIRAVDTYYHQQSVGEAVALTMKVMILRVGLSDEEQLYRHIQAACTGNTPPIEAGLEY